MLITTQLERGEQFVFARGTRNVVDLGLENVHHLPIHNYLLEGPSALQDQQPSVPFGTGPAHAGITAACSATENYSLNKQISIADYNDQLYSFLAILSI